MPILTCPKCQGKMRFPDDSDPRRVKCPTCGNTFLSSDGNKTGPTSGTGAKGAKTVEDVPGRRRRDEEDDDRERDRDRRRRDDDDDAYDDRRRSRSRPRDDDEDDDRRRRRRDDDEDDYDDRRRRRRRPDPARAREAIEGQFNRAAIGCLLNFISGWLWVGGLLMLAFVVFLHWIGVQEGLNVFAILGGILGLCHWLTSGTGIGFLVSGPRDRGALGLAIATAAAGALHLIVLVIVGTSRTHVIGPQAVFGLTSNLNWTNYVTQSLALSQVIYIQIGFSDFRIPMAEGSFLTIFANLLEVARNVLFLLTLRSIMLCARDSKGAKLVMKTLIAYVIGAGAVVLCGVLFGLLFLSVLPKGAAARGAQESLSAVHHLYDLVSLLILAGLGVWITLVVKVVKGTSITDGIEARRNRGFRATVISRNSQVVMTMALVMMMMMTKRFGQSGRRNRQPLRSLQPTS